MELGADRHHSGRSRLIATVTHVCTIDYVARMLDEDPELLEAIVSNDDNLTYGAIISVYTSSEEAITALTDRGIEELRDMLTAARITPETWHEFLDDFVHDADLVARIKAQSPGSNRPVTPQNLQTQKAPAFQGDS
jgi:hypothetical protein